MDGPKHHIFKYRVFSTSLKRYYFDMQKEETLIPGCFVLKPRNFEDSRGSFLKSFNRDVFRELGICYDYSEVFYSVSHKDVVRGMHFQLPPHAVAKVVYVTSGSIIDVILDLRTDSPTYGQSLSLDLSAKNALQVFIPTGCAHGFITLEDNTQVHYLQSDVYDPQSDTGIRYDSFLFDWGAKNPILSERDLSFPKLGEFSSPFYLKD